MKRRHYLFLFSAISIPTFYAVGMLFGKQSHFVITDFWRFWVVHLWVEDFLGHGALMGVYGMLAMGFFVFVARYFIPPDRKSERAMQISFWSLNLGLGYMLFANLVPIGMFQLWDSFQNGYWHARAPRRKPPRMEPGLLPNPPNTAAQKPFRPSMVPTS